MIINVQYTDSRLKNFACKCIVFVKLLFISVSCLTSTPCLAKESPQKILILNSYHKAAWTDSLLAGINSVLDEISKLDMVIEYMDTKRISTEDYYQTLTKIYQMKYGSISFDVILTSDDNAYRFALEKQNDLFNKSPIVFCGVNRFDPKEIKDNPLVTGVIEKSDFQDTLAFAAKVYKDASAVHVIIDHTATSKINRDLFTQVLKRNLPKLNIEFLIDISLSELSKRLSEIPSNDFAFFISFWVDDGGKPISPDDLSTAFSKSSVPIFGRSEWMINRGMTGGKCVSGFNQGQVAAKLVKRIFSGESPSDIPVEQNSPNRFMFDYSLLKKFNIDSSILPADSIIINKLPLTFYQKHTKLIWAVNTVIILLITLVLMLVANIIKRRKTERALSTSEKRFRLLYENAQIGWGFSNLGDGKLIECNKQLAYIYGYDDSESCVVDWVGSEHYVNPDQHRQYVTILNEVGEVLDFEVPIRRKDGAVIWLRYSSRLHRDKNLIEFVGTDVTDRKKTEKELINYRDHLEDLVEQRTDELKKLSRAVEQSPISIVITDKQGNIEYVNPTFCNVTGYTNDEVIGQNPGILRSDKHTTKFYINLWDTIKSGKIWSGEMINKKKNGKEFWERVTIAPLLDQNEEISHFVGVKEDISDQKKLENDLIMAKNIAETANRDLTFTKFAFDNAPDAIEWVRAEDASIVYVNKHTTKLLGYSKEEMSQMFVHDFDPNFGSETWPKFYDQMQKKEEMTFETEWITKDDNKLPVEVAARSLVYEGQEYFIAFIRDITEQKLAQAELKAAKKKAEYSAQESNRLLIETNLRNKELNNLNRVGKALAEQIDLKKMIELVGETLHDSLNPFAIYIALHDADTNKVEFPYLRVGKKYHKNETLEFGKGLVSRVIQTSEPLLCSSYQQQIDLGGVDAGDNCESYLGVPIFAGKKAIGALSILQKEPDWFSDSDVDLMNTISANLGVAIENARLFEESENSRQAAESANRAKSIFLANMSHEIRTPMNAILGHSQILQRDKTLGQKQLKSIKSINKSGEHLLSLINDILDMSKIEAGKVTILNVSFSLYHLLNEIFELFKMRMEQQSIGFEMVLTDDLPDLIKADEGRIRQVVLNLVGNAAKFTKKGKISIAAHLKNGRIEVVVADTGPGISKSETETIFEAFEQAEKGMRTSGGTGLGLAISRQMARLMGGDILVESTIGVGSSFRFSFTFELADQDDIEQKTSHDTIKKLKPGQRQTRILIVDDRKENRDVARLLLEPVGFQMKEAENGKEALEIFKTWHPQVILMDIVMPVMDGLEATRQIKAHKYGSSTSVVAVSASALDDEREKVLKHGADSFIKKPYKDTELFEEIRRYTGVEYEYENTEKTDAQTLEKRFSPEVLGQLPEGLKNKAKQAAIVGKMSQFDELIEEIFKINPVTAEYLKGLVDDFELERLQELFK